MLFLSKPRHVIGTKITSSMVRVVIGKYKKLKVPNCSIPMSENNVYVVVAAGDQ
jgi:hypothetical protein